MMKIVGGQFGVTGSAFLSRDKRLVIDGAKRGVYASNQINAVNAETVKEKRFGIMGFILGAIFLVVFFSVLFGALGGVIGFGVAIAGSFYTEKHNFVDVHFTDGASVRLECTPRGVNKLVAFSATSDVDHRSV